MARRSSALIRSQERIPGPHSGGYGNRPSGRVFQGHEKPIPWVLIQVFHSLEYLCQRHSRILYLIKDFLPASILTVPAQAKYSSGFPYRMTFKVKVKVAQLCLTLCDPMDYTVHGILQARIIEWVAFPFSRESSQPRDQTQVSCIADRFFTSWATREAVSTTF